MIYLKDYDAINHDDVKIVDSNCSAGVCANGDKIYSIGQALLDFKIGEGILANLTYTFVT